jgi:hypothetical protein
MNLELDKNQSRLILNIIDNNTNAIDRSVYWSFDDLRSACSKMKSLIVVSAIESSIQDEVHYHYNSSTIFFDFNFEKFLDCIEQGIIQFDIRIGVSNTGKNLGKTHDHGSGFRVRRDNVKDLYDEVVSEEETFKLI